MVKGGIQMRRNYFPNILGIILIIAGIFCIFSPVASSALIPYMVGLGLAVTGIGKIFRWAKERHYYRHSGWNLAGAVASLLAGILLAVSPSLQLSVNFTVVMLIGCWIMVMGILRIIHAFQLKSVQGYMDLFGRPVSND